MTGVISYLAGVAIILGFFGTLFRRAQVWVAQQLQATRDNTKATQDNTELTKRLEEAFERLSDTVQELEARIDRFEGRNK